MRRLCEAALVAAGALCLGAALVAARPNPDQTIEIVLGRDGFRPDVLRLKQGETARLMVKAAEGDHCLAIDAFRVEKRLQPGKSVTVDLTPDRAGTFPFYCCLESGAAAEKERGQLIVSE
jgi:heme/copper-type cytochrome/quinol oxidase subunit 2